MASPGDSFKTNIFGQLKSYSSAVHDAFEQRIARPLLAFKRDLSRPTSETRAPSDQETTSSTHVRQESSSSSSPLEIIDIDTTNSFKNIFNKVRHSLSPSPIRRTYENPASNRTNMSSKESRNLSLCVTASKSPRQSHLRNKSVSFAENIESDNDNDNDSDSDSDNQYSINDRNIIIQNANKLADKILKASINATAAKTELINQSPTKNDDGFDQEFYQIMKPRRISLNNIEDLVYQDISAEIVSYILKHALRTLKKEQDELLISTTHQTLVDENAQKQSSITTQNETIVDQNEEDEDFIDLK